MRRARTLMILSAGAALLLTAAAESQARPTSTANGLRAVTVKSDYGNGVVTAPVRRGQFGPQVRLPGGVRYDCETSCADTLRREALDYWETQSEESGGDRN